MNWHVVEINDGNDIKKIMQVFKQVKIIQNKPSLINLKLILLMAVQTNKILVMLMELLWELMK